MRITVKRGPDDPGSVPGTLSVDDQLECFTLERPRTGDHPCIPAGIYSVILTPSPHLGYVTPELLNVPGRSAIRIHIANHPFELLGCIAVGEKHIPDVVMESKAAFDSLMLLLRSTLDQITITVEDPV